jgi:hypothetical protein
LPDADSGLFNFKDFNNLAILHYNGTVVDDPSQEPWLDAPNSSLPLVETNLHVSLRFSISDLFIYEVNISYCPAPCPDARGTILFNDPLYVDF